MPASRGSSATVPASDRRRWRSSSWAGYLLTLPAVVAFIAFVAYPLAHTVLLSLYAWSPIHPAKLYVGLGNFRELFSDPNFAVAARNNGWFILLSLLIQMPLGLLLAIGLNSTLRRHRLLRTAFFAPFVLPVVAVGLVWQLIYEPNLGALNSLLHALGWEQFASGWLGDPVLAIFAVIAVSCWRYVGFHMMILLAGLQSIPEELYEAARIDGAGPWRQFTHITLPCLRRVLLVDALLITVGSIKIFDLVQVMTGGGPGFASDVLATFMYRTAFTYWRMGYSAAIAVVMLVLTLVLTVAYIRLTGKEEYTPTVRRLCRLRQAWVRLAAACGRFVPSVRREPQSPRATEWVELSRAQDADDSSEAADTEPSDASHVPHRPRRPALWLGRVGPVIQDTVMLLLAAVFILPIVWSLVSAFKPLNELLLKPWALPQSWAWSNFATAWNGGVGRFLLNSAIITAITVIVMLLLAMPAAYALARLRLRGGAIIFGIILGGILVPVHAAVLPLYQLSSSLGISGWAAILGPYIAFCIPLAVLLLRAYFAEVPQELLDAALIDGAGHMRILWSVFAPIARPAIATVAVFQAAWVWNELLFAMVFISDKKRMTLPVGLLSFQGEHSVDWSVVMAGVALAMVPVLALYLVFQRHVVKGLTAGAVK